MDYTLTGPATGECSVPALFTLTPVNPITGSVNVTLYDPGGGTFDPPVVALTGSAPVQVQLTRTTWCPDAIFALNDGGLIDPPPLPFLSKIQLGASGTAPSGIRMPNLGGASLLNGDLAALKRDARTLAVHPNSAGLLAFAGTRKLSILFYPSTANGGNSKYGMPVNVASGYTGTWDLIVTQYLKDADPPPCRMDPSTTCIENYQGTLPPLSFAALGPSDHHALCIVRDEVTGGPAILEEAYQIFWDATAARWSCNSFCRWDLRTGDFRPLGRASVDAAGLPITPLLVRYDEAAAGAIDHAIRITLPGGATRNRSVWPARTAVTAGTALSGIPMGAILRMSDSWYQANRGVFTGPAGSVVDALWKYGAIVADITGSPAWQIVGVQDERWNLSNVLQLQTIPIASFEVCDFGPGWTFEGPSSGRVGVTQRFYSRHLPADDHNFSSQIYLQEIKDGVKAFRDNKTLSDANTEIELVWTPQTSGQRTLKATQSTWTDIEPPDILFTAYVAGAPVPGAPPPLQLARLLRRPPTVPAVLPQGGPPPLRLARLLRATPTVPPVVPRGAPPPLQLARLVTVAAQFVPPPGGVPPPLLVPRLLWVRPVVPPALPRGGPPPLRLVRLVTRAAQYVPEAADDFWTALLAWLNADPELAADFPGGFIQGEPAIEQTMPYVIVDQLDVNIRASSEDNVFRPGFRIYAAADDVAGRLAAALSRRCTATRRNPPLAFYGEEDDRVWIEAGWVPLQGARKPQFIGFAADRVEVWRVDRQFFVNVVAYRPSDA